jgi:NitT/TauT family transport system substrate-binding protein
MTSLRFILNTFYSGPQAWFFLAEDLGYFREEGLSISFTEGDTLANAVPRVASGAFDVGYGDVNALIELAATLPAGEVLPLQAVFALHNASPYTIAVPADSPIRTPRDLVGHTLASHPQDAALRMFPELAIHAGFQASDVGVVIDATPHPQMLQTLLGHGSSTNPPWSGLFGFVNTLRAAAMEVGIDPATQLRFLEYQHHLPDLYGAALMVSSRLIAQSPKVVTGLVRAINRALHATIANPNAAIDAVARRNPNINRAANHARLVGTLALEMAHAEGATLGIGEMDDARLQRTIELIVAAKHHPRVPNAHEVFNRQFMPPLGARVTALAQRQE